MSAHASPESPIAFDVFISYASVDREPVERLVQKLKQDGYRVWFDVEQMGGGGATLGQLADGIANSSHMIVCLSDAYVDRDWTKFELDTNQSFDPANKLNRTIPVVVRPMSKQWPRQIRSFNTRDLTNSSAFETEYQTLIRRITRAPEFVPPVLDRDTLQKACHAPFEHLDEPNVALFQVRIAAQTICKFLHRRILGEPPSDATVDLLVEKLLASGKLPPPIRISLGTVQTYGNFVVKDELEDYTISQDSIQPGLAALKVLADWTLATYFGMPEKDFWEAIWSRLPHHGDRNEREIPGSNYMLLGPRLTLNSLGPLYAGRSKVLRHAVAVNLAALSKEQEEGFFEEVSHFVRLSNASIVRPLDAGRVVVQGQALCLYVVLEHVNGPAGQELAERFGALPALAACELCRGVALALEAFHAAEPPIVHGDLKPANVMVDQFGTLKVLCIGRNAGVTASQASEGAAGGKIDSFLFSSPEQLSGNTRLTSKTDLFALRAMLFYLLTGEYEARMRGGEVTLELPATASAALERLADCETAQRAREVLDTACQELAGGVKLREVMESYREGKPLPETSTAAPAPKAARRAGFSLLAEIPVECRGAWPLGGDSVLVWEAGGDTLAILKGSELTWRDSQPIRVRRVARGPSNQLAAGGWDGELRCFAEGKLAAVAKLAGAVGDVQHCGERWVAGTWKKLLVSLSPNGTLNPLLNVERGVFRIAVMTNSDRFAVADLGAGIALYAGATRVRDIPPLGKISGIVFAGRRLMVLSGQHLIALELDGTVGRPERQPGAGNLRLLPSAGRCLLISDDGNSWLIEESGTHLPGFRFPAGAVVLSSGQDGTRFTLRHPSGGCTYWCDGEEKQSWPKAIAAELSLDGRQVAVTLPDKVQLYEDNQ